MYSTVKGATQLIRIRKLPPLSDASARSRRIVGPDQTDPHVLSATDSQQTGRHLQDHPDWSAGTPEDLPDPDAVQVYRAGCTSATQFHM